MIYLIKNDYYIKVGTNKYVKLKFVLKDEEVEMVPTNVTFESNASTHITPLLFKNEKEKIKKDLLKKRTKFEEEKKFVYYE